MMPRCAAPIALAIAALVVAHPGAEAQQKQQPARAESGDSVLARASGRYVAGALTRFFLGDTYRDLWSTPFRAPVLDLQNFAGGLRPTKLGGGLSTITLRMEARDGREFVFRPIDKDKITTPYPYGGSVVDRIFRDQVSALHPAGAVIADTILQTAGVLHPHPSFAVMPDTPILGEFREQFAGRLGMIEEYPNVPSEAPGFAGALEIIDSEDLLELLNSDPMQRVDSRAMLRARLIDVLISDNDRHAGQWKWARMTNDKPVRWVPISRDRDHAFVQFDGWLVRLTRLLAAPHLILFEGSDMNLAALTEHRGFDGRMFADLNRAQWDSVVREITSRITDDVIDAALLRQPAEYAARSSELAAILRERRDMLRETALRWYRSFAVAPDIHATDTADRAIVTRVNDRYVDVRLETPGGVPYFFRRYDARETADIRVYLHGGDDYGVIRGNVNGSIRVRLIGGNGNNTLIDSSTVNGDRDESRLYDVGESDGVSYGPDTLFNRKPWEYRNGMLQPAGPDRGNRMVPHFSYSTRARLGEVPRLGVVRYDYGFRYRPYYNRTSLQAEYATRLRGWRLTADTDYRMESSPLHFRAQAAMSDLEVVAFHGLGNMIAPQDAGADYYEVRQRQWMLHPSVGLALGIGGDISLGPVLQYSSTDSVADRFISETRPYGFGDFGQVGLRLKVRMDFDAGRREPIVHEDALPIILPPLHRFRLDAEASHYPAAWSVKSPFQSIEARGQSFVTIPLPTSPVLLFRGGATRVFGEFPFHEAAFIGGPRAARSVGFQSFEGDAAVYGSAELRVRLAKFVFVMPLDAGLVGLGDASRVYVDGTSPGGWHAAAGGGMWFGLRDSPFVFTLAFIDNGERTRFTMRSGLGF